MLTEVLLHLWQYYRKTLLDMRYESIFREYKILVSFVLLAVVPAGLRGGDHPRIKSIRTVVYEPILKDTSWGTGRVVDYIQFVKYDSKGRKVVENRLKPDGSPLGKLVYRYNADGQVAREIYATADKGVSNCWDYTYDANGHLNCIVTMDGQEDTIQIYSAQYSEDGKVLKKLNNDYKKKVLLGRQVVYDKDGHPVKVIEVVERLRGREMGYDSSEKGRYTLSEQIESRER